MNDVLSSGSWIVARTHAHKEQVAITNLYNQGFEAYCPRVRRRVRHARRVQNVLRPLFSGYVFIRVNLRRDQWRPILSTVGICNLVRFGDRLGVLPMGFIDSLRCREKDGAIPLPNPRDSYVPGEVVRLRDGPFENLTATVLACGERERVLLLMNILNQTVRIQAPLNQVAPA